MVNEPSVFESLKVYYIDTIPDDTPLCDAWFTALGLKLALPPWLLPVPGGAWAPPPLVMYCLDAADCCWNKAFGSKVRLINLNAKKI